MNDTIVNCAAAMPPRDLPIKVASRNHHQE
jgi:hypothetical protein